MKVALCLGLARWVGGTPTRQPARRRRYASSELATAPAHRWFVLAQAAPLMAPFR
jgi:hypothetical protein